MRENAEVWNHGMWGWLGCLGLTLGDSALDGTGQVCVQCQRQSFVPLVVVKRWQHWTQGHGVACRKVRTTHPHKDTHWNAHTCGPVNTSAKNLSLLYTVCSDDYLMRFDAGVLWALSELARAPMHFNALSLLHYFAVVCLLHCCPAPPFATLWLSFFFSFLYWTRKDRRIMVINSTKTSWKTDWGHRSDEVCVCVWQKERERVHVWCSYTSASKRGGLFKHGSVPHPVLWSLWCCHLTCPAA